MSIYTYWEKKKSHIATLTLVICCIINVNIYQVQPSNEHVHQRSNANIFLDEKDLVMGKSETHVANMLESHLFSQVKGMVDAHGETTVENQGKTDTKSHSSDLLKGQGLGANTGKGKNHHKGKHKGKHKMTAEQRQAAKLETRLRMETHAKTWAKTQARAMAKAAAAQQAKETQRLRAEAAAAAHDELMVLSRMEKDLHKAQRATAASLPKLELNPRLARKSPKLLTEDEKLLEMLKHPERYVEKNVDLDHPAIPAKPNQTHVLSKDKHVIATKEHLKAINDVINTLNETTKATKAKGKKTLHIATNTITSHTNTPNGMKNKSSSSNNNNNNNSNGKKNTTSSSNSKKSTKHSKHVAIARHVVEKLKEHHEHKQNVSEELKKPHTRESALINLASFLNLDSKILNGHSMEHLRPKKPTNHHYRKHHVIRHHPAAPNFWPKKRHIVKKSSEMRFRQGRINVQKNMKSMIHKVFSHPFWHTRPTAQQQKQQQQAQQKTQDMRFQQQYMKQNGQFFSTRGQQAPRQFNNGGYPGAQQQQQQQQPRPQQHKKTMDSPFGFNDLNSQLGNDAAQDFQNVRNENNAAAARNNAGGRNSFSAGSGGLESPANGGLPSMATSNSRPTDPTIGVGSSGGNPFAGTMPPPSAVKYTYGKDVRNTQGRRPPPPPPAAVPPPPPVGQGSNAMPLARGPHPVKPSSSSNSNGVNSAFLPQTPQAGSKPISAPPPPLPMAPQQAGAAPAGGPKPVMSPSVVTTIPIKRRRL
jgi:hypothetical protein